MATGYSLNGFCYTDMPAALAGYKLQFPQTDAFSVNDLVTASYSGNTISYNINSRQMSSNALNSRTGSLTLPTCQLQGTLTTSITDMTIANDLSKHEFFHVNIILVIACLIMFALGFSSR